MEKPGRNTPCPCGSGLKYKRCCLPKEETARRFTQADRRSALDKLERFSEEVLEGEDDAAFEEFWGDDPGKDVDLDEYSDRLSTGVFDGWFWFDRPLPDGRLVVDRLLAEDVSLTTGEREYLALIRASCMRLWQVDDVRPGLSLTLRDVLDGSTVTVHERLGSRQIARADMLAARVIDCGASGQPEMEAGVLPIPFLIRQAVVSQLASQREAFTRENPRAPAERFWKEVPPFFHSAWIQALADPPIPHLRNQDGDDILFTRVHFDVRDAARLGEALDAAPTLERDGQKPVWRWTGPDAAGEPVILGHLEIRGAILTLEANSAKRGERGRALVEDLAGDAAVHRATSHEDPTLSLKEKLRERGAGREDEPADKDDGIPPAIREELTLDHYARHYRKWLDEKIPALDGHTPREAAKDPALTSRVAGLIRDLEGFYQTSLKRNEPAFDPSWMWADLGLEDAAPARPPPLAHERWAQAAPGWGDLCGRLAARARAAPGFDDTSSLIARGDLEADLEVRRFLQTEVEREKADATGVAAASEAALAARLHCAVNFELHRRKTFWVDPALAYMLAHTDLDVVGDDLRLPFACFAVVLTDRYSLSLAERHLAGAADCTLAGQILHVLTIYVSGEPHGDGRVLHLQIAADALGADPPYLLEHDLPVTDSGPIELGTRPATPPVVKMDGQEVTVGPRSRPLPELLHLALSAILYATSAGVESQVLRPSAGRTKVLRAPGGPPPVFSSEEVFFLPGAISISEVRRMQDLERVPSGRQLLHRFMVRGHWRRPARSWKDRRNRWITPYWKGPDVAAIIERTYRLEP